MIVGDKLPWPRVFKLHAPVLTVVLAVAAGLFVVERTLHWHLRLGTAPFSVVGVALSIFLAFRNNAAYDRWWESRKLWGGIVNVSRTVARQVVTLIEVPREAAGDVQTTSVDDVRTFQRDLVYHQIAFVNALRGSLRKQDFGNDIAPFLSEADRAALISQINVPAAIVHRMSVRIAEAARRGWLSEERWARLDHSLTEVVALQGGCERILNTPIPLAYRLFTNRLVRVYCCALPFGLVDHLGVLTIAAVILVSFVFLVLDAIGRLIEAPFAMGPNALPLSAICRTIEINLRQQLGETDLPPALTPVRDGNADVLL